ncbi:hypothetical protein ACFL35_16245, partial [Candidatus Riflebacteria bacterium]
KVELGEPLSIKSGDIILFCSDGLFKFMNEQSIGETIMEHSKTVQTLAEALVNKAMVCGGNENTTVLISKVEDDDLKGSNILPFPGKKKEEVLEEDTWHFKLSINPKEILFYLLAILLLLILGFWYFKARMSLESKKR